MTLAIVYSNNTQECDRVTALFDNLGQPYKEYILGSDFTLKQFDNEFGSEAQFPQVAIGTKHIGGLKETLQHLQTNNVL